MSAHRKLYVLKLTNNRHVIEMVRVAKIMYQHYIGLCLFLSLQSTFLTLWTAIYIERETNVRVRPFQFDVLFHEYADCIFCQSDL